MYIVYAITADGEKIEFCAENIIEAAKIADSYMHNGAVKVEIKKKEGVA